MRFLVKLVVLGFAGLGVYKAWELLGPKVSEVQQSAAGARDKIEPAIRDAADTIQSATKEAADTISDAASSAVSDDVNVSAQPAPPHSAEKVAATPKLGT